MSPFADRLADAVLRRATPVLVGLDPRFSQLPEPLQTGVDPNDYSAVATAYQTFCQGVLDVVAPLVPAVKPQLAFFEQLGPPGLGALAQVVQYARQLGLLVILDGKRNDIGSTATAYAQAYLGAESPWQGDALTVSPYLGEDSLEPFLTTCQDRNAGIFVLVKTSNPGSGMFQDVRAAGDQRPLYAHVAAWVETQAAARATDRGYGPVGAVVGATYPEQLAELRAAMPHAWLLIPGYGAQGAAAADVAAGFDSRGLGAIVNSSRAIIFAHSRPEFRSPSRDDQWQKAIEAATREMIDQLRSDTPAGRL
jgi:orotidine-5'-phosphate decarboxylase